MLAERNAQRRAADEHELNWETNRRVRWSKSRHCGMQSHGSASGDTNPIFLPNANSIMPTFAASR